ncbi:MAG: DNA translocase FtsK, partial [Candidatus Roizmanbacteria bacterium]
MGRNKKFITLAIPLLGKYKVDRRMFATLIGVLCFTIASLLLLSFTRRGELLIIVHDELTYRFGGAALLVPLFIFLLGSHFFQTKKLKFITYNVTIGFMLLSIALMGVLKTGQFGVLMWTNLISDFSVVGAMLLLFVTFLVGIIFFFNTSLDIIVLFLVTVINHANEFVVAKIFGKTVSKKRNTSEFIQDAPAPVMPVPPKPTTAAQQETNDQLHMKAFSSKSYAQWKFPPINLLQDVKDGEADYGDPSRNSDIIERTLESFGIRAQVSEINKGPTVSQYALQIAVGTKLSKITALANDLALALAAKSGMIRIEAPIPGRAMVGIEIPNKKFQTVTLKSMLESEALADRS